MGPTVRSKLYLQVYLASFLNYQKSPNCVLEYKFLVEQEVVVPRVAVTQAPERARAEN